MINSTKYIGPLKVRLITAESRHGMACLDMCSFAFSLCAYYVVINAVIGTHMLV